MNANITNLDLEKLPIHSDRNVEIANLEDEVVEAAIAWRNDERGILGNSLSKLNDAVEALIAARERNG